MSYVVPTKPAKKPGMPSLALRPSLSPPLPPPVDTRNESHQASLDENKQRIQQLQNVIQGLSIEDHAASERPALPSPPKDAPPKTECLRLLAEDMEDLGRLGEGSAGEVRKVRHKKTGLVMARKVRYLSVLSVLRD
jgi:hypothetical protein